MTGLRRLLVAIVTCLVLVASPLSASSLAQASLPGVVASSVPTSLLQELLSLDQGLFTLFPTSGGVRYSWLDTSVAFDAPSHSVVASGGGTPPLTLRSSIGGAAGASTVAGRIIVDSQPGQGRDVVYFPFDGGVETFDVLGGPASPRTIRWGVESGGQPLLVDIDRGTATMADGTVVATTGVNCRTAGAVGVYKPEATAQAHAIRRLSKIHGSAGPFFHTVPNELDWEVGKRSDPVEEPPCDGTAGFRVDIVLDVSGALDRGGK